MRYALTPRPRMDDNILVLTEKYFVTTKTTSAFTLRKPPLFTLIREKGCEVWWFV
jgi:hypothetical protein